MADTAPTTLRRDFLKGMMVTGALLPLAGAAVAHGATDVQARWNAALADYRQLRAISDGLPAGHSCEDAAIDAYCEAMDRLLEMPAPDKSALDTKLDLIGVRYEADLEGPLGDLVPLLMRDAAHLAGGVA